MKHRDHEALVRLAERCERVFRLPSPRAPGAAFFGAEITVRAFGLDGYGPARISLAGKGLTAEAAFRSCMGEVAEYLSGLFWGDEPLVELDLGDALSGFNPRHREWILGQLSCSEGSDVGRQHFMPAQQLGAAVAAHLPYELCLRLPDGDRRSTRAPFSSSGSAAAPSLEEAVLAGLFEVIERDAAALWWYGGRRPTAVNAASEMRAAKFVGKLRRGVAAERALRLLDLTTETAVPAVAAVTAAPDGSAVAVGLAAGLDLDVALERATLEACQMELAQDLVLLKRSQQGEEALNRQDRAILRRMTALNLFDDPVFEARVDHAGQPPSTAVPDEEALADSARRLAKAGYAAYWVDLSREKISVPVCRVVIPGLQNLPFTAAGRRLTDTAAAAGLAAADINSRLPLL